MTIVLETRNYLSHTLLMTNTKNALPNARTKNSPRATMTVSSDIRDTIDGNGTEYMGTATVVWSVSEMGKTSRFSKRFESREAANEWANQQWAKIK